MSRNLSHDILLATGALGYGAYLNGAWFRGDWSPHQGLPLRSIQWQELFAIVAAACTWGHLLQGQRITVHCDNMAIVQAWSNQSARHPEILHLLRTLFFITAKHSQPTANTSTSRAGRTLSHQMEKLLRRALAPSTFNTYQTGIKSPPQTETSTNHQQGQMVSQLDRDHRTAHDRLMLKAAITLGFFGLLRVSEFTVENQHGFNHEQHLTMEDITMHKDSNCG
ncbi:hypothetical protein EMCRGX_G000869 [Ephydatia muelleri]